jgi:phosphoribosylformylglycinamidine synthase subunit PurL
VATVGGETVFDPCYAGNPLVNVLCVGVMPADAIQLARAESVGDIAVLIGQRTGRDGIGGASVLASAEFDEGGVDQAKRPNVQVGDPFAGKLLIESCLQLYAEGLLSGIQDMGAAGIACSTSEMASAAGMGMRVDLDNVPLREASMEAWEILCSESQERMLALVSPDKLDRVLDICRRWGVQATPIGEVIDGDRLIFTRHGELVHDAPAAALAAEGPVYERPVTDWRHPHAHDDVDAEDGPAELRGAAMALLSSPNLASSRFVWQQYDSIVGSGTFQGPGSDAAVIRLPEAGNRGVAIATDGNGRWCALDPREGAKLVVAEAARNVAVTGARPVAATNCLNFGSPERPEIMGQFRDVIAGMGEACSALGTPITGGNVSFYNQTGDTAVHPTPVVGVLGTIDDVTAAVPVGFREAGDAIYLIGAPTRPGLGGSEYLWVTQQRIAGAPPRVDLTAERRLHELLIAQRDLLRSAHDVSTGGLLATLVESCQAGGLGAEVHAENGLPVHQWLFSESPTRVVVTVAAGEAAALEQACAAAGVHAIALGTVTADRTLVAGDVLTLDLDEVRTLQEEALPAALGLTAT